MPYNLPESAVHDVINLFQVTALDATGKYVMYASPAKADDYIEFFAEQDLLLALSACPGGDLSTWSFEEGEGKGGMEAMKEVCRPLKIEVFGVEQEVLKGWVKPTAADDLYRGMHGITVPRGEE